MIAKKTFEPARVAHLTRHQHILLRLGEWIAYAECAGCLARRAALMVEGRLNEKANLRFDATALAALNRTFAREAALKVGEEGLRWVAGAGAVSDAEMAAFETSLEVPAIHCAQAGLLSDMDYIADSPLRSRGEAHRSSRLGSKRRQTIFPRPHACSGYTGASSWKTPLIER